MGSSRGWMMSFRVKMRVEWMGSRWMWMIGSKKASVNGSGVFLIKLVKVLSKSGRRPQTSISDTSSDFQTVQKEKK